MRGVPYVREARAVWMIDAATDAPEAREPFLLRRPAGVWLECHHRRPDGEAAWRVYERGAGGDDIMLTLPFASV